MNILTDLEFAEVMELIELSEDLGVVLATLDQSLDGAESFPVQNQ